MTRSYRAGHAAYDAVNSFMNGYKFAEGVKDRKKDRARQDKQDARNDVKWDQSQADRKLSLSDAEYARGRTRAADERADALQVPVDQAIQQRDQDRAHKVEKQSLDITNAKLNAQGKRIGNKAASNRLTRAEEKDERESVQRATSEAIHLLSSEFGQQLDNPETRRAAMGFREALMNGSQIENGVTSQQVYDFADKMFHRELKVGVGEESDQGVITNKRINAIRQVTDKDSPHYGKYMIELAVRVRGQDGKEKEYEGKPVTKNRTSVDTDEVQFFDADALMDRVNGFGMLAKDVESAGGVQNAIAQLEAKNIGAGGKPDAVKKPKALDPDEAAIKLINATRDRTGSTLSLEEAKKQLAGNYKGGDSAVRLDNGNSASAAQPAPQEGQAAPGNGGNFGFRGMVDSVMSWPRGGSDGGNPTPTQPAQPAVAQPPQGSEPAPVEIKSKADFDKLPVGALFIAPDGSVRRKQA